jgi:hypothetical protein
MKPLLHILNGFLFAVPAAIYTGQEAIKNIANYQGKTEDPFGKMPKEKTSPSFAMEDPVINFFGPLVGSSVAFAYGYGLSAIAHPLMPAAVAVGIYASSRVTKCEDSKVKELK